MPASQIDLAAFTPNHLDTAFALSQAAGWPHRRDDWAMMLGLSQGFVAVEAERVVGTLMLTRFGADDAAINLVIVDAALRGRGIGRRLMAQAVVAARDRTCRLTATADGLPLYESLGFRAVGSIAQHQGRVAALSAGEGVDWVDPAAARKIAGLDRAATGVDRSALIDTLFARGRVAALRKGGAITGFVAVRAFGRGTVVGPVVAPTTRDAETLLRFAFAMSSGFVRVDTPVEDEIGGFLTGCGLTLVDTGVAMVRGRPSLRGHDVQTFALASQALG